MYSFLWTVLILHASVLIPTRTQHILLFTTTHNVHIMNTSHPAEQQIIAEGPLSSAILGPEYCFNESLICWCEAFVEAINCISSDPRKWSKKVNYAKGGIYRIEKLACDWLTKKLYWTDGKAKKIEVVSLKTKDRNVVIWQDLDKVRDIAVDPLVGLLFWSDWGQSPRIERSSMDGNSTTRRVIISKDIVTPNGISLDVKKKKIYWVDLSLLKIEVTNYDGGNRVILVNEGLYKPYTITQSKDELYWTDWQTLSIYSYNMTAGGPANIVMNYTGYTETVVNVKIIEESAQPAKATPCDLNNGGCSHLCLLSSEPPGYSCICPAGISSINETTCANGFEYVVVVLLPTIIGITSLDTSYYYTWKLPLDIKYATKLDYDPVEKQIYWSDKKAHTIQRVNFDGKRQEKVISDVHPQGIAIDWSARNLYFVEYVQKRIDVLKLNFTYRKAIIFDGIEYPEAVAVSPERGLLWWTDCGESFPKIERAWLDGSNRFTLVKDQISCATSLAVDLEIGELYWGDGPLGTIEGANMLNGLNRRSIVKEDVLANIWGISILNDRLFSTNSNLGTIAEMNKTSGQDRSVILGNFPDLMAIKAINMRAELQPAGKCYVDNGGCGQFCYNLPDEKMRCDCQIDYELQLDGKTCAIPDAFMIIRSVDHLRKISIRNSTIGENIPIRGIDSVNAYSMDSINRSLYLVDKRFNTINHTFLNGLETETIIGFDIRLPISISIDWIGSNLYWIDGDNNKRIMVSILDGTSEKVLFWKDLNDPRNLILCPSIGFMYWSEWDGSKGTVFRAAMDGTSKLAIIIDLEIINGLAFDYDQRLLYRLQTKNTISRNCRIEIADMNGRRTRVIVLGAWFRPTSLAVHRDSLYWLDDDNRSVIRADKLDGANTAEFCSQTSKIIDFILVDSKKWYNGYLNCDQCEHLCLIKPTGREDFEIERSCVCPTHYQMVNGTCHFPDNFLLYSSNNILHQFTTNIDEYPNVPFQVPLPPGINGIRAIEYDPISKYVYWIDDKDLAIKRYAQSRSSIEMVFGGDQSSGEYNFHDLALDPYNRMLFWSCSLTDSINVIRMNSGFSYLGQIFVDVGGKPRKIAIDADKAYIFWTDNGAVSGIRRLRLGRRYVEHIIIENKTIEAITVDPRSNLLFYSYNMKIFSCSLSGGRRKLLVRENLGLKIAALAVTDSFLYYQFEYSRWHSSIERISKFTANESITIVKNVQVTDLISVKSPNESHPCNSLNNPPDCSHLCIPSRVNPQEAVCTCLMQFRLDDDRMACSKSPEYDQGDFKCSEGTSICCSEDDFRCTSDSKCVPKRNLCDGIEDCEDASDEKSCHDYSFGVWSNFLYMILILTLFISSFVITYVVLKEKCGKNGSINEQDRTVELQVTSGQRTEEAEEGIPLNERPQLPDLDVSSHLCTLDSSTIETRSSSIDWI